mmetsp:Transcript_67773/g.163850  ORF Transcript_67773/g.163850 Transcript_67773/m.163850 type:complete len:266 (+) Transcript_67773:448-1245(+)
MCRARTFSVPSFLARFAAGSALSATTSKTPTKQLANRAGPVSPRSPLRAAASAATNSDADFGCLAKARTRSKTSVSLRTAAPLLRSARWCAPSCSCSSSVMSTWGFASRMGRGSLRSRKPNALVTVTASKAATPSSLSAGATKDSKASSRSQAARSCSAYARLPDSSMPSFASCSLSSPALHLASSGEASSGRPRRVTAAARDITAPVAPAVCSRRCSVAVASASASQNASITAAAFSAFSKASLARGFNSSGTLSGWTRKASLL